MISSPARERALTAKEMRLLERVFEREISGTLPFQSKANLAQELVDRGYLEPMVRTFGANAFGAVTVRGFALTHAGRIAYCEWAARSARRSGGG